MKHGIITDIIGDKSWYINDKLHRTDGPAVEWADGDKYWCINDVKYSFSEWLKLSSLSNEEKIELVLINENI